MSKITAPAMLALSLLISIAHAGPRILSYQGSLLDSSGQAVPDGSYDMRFRIYRDKDGTVPAWQEIEGGLSVVNGLFSTVLGDQTNFTTQFSNDFTLWLEVAVDLNGNGTFAPEEVYAPRQRLAGAGWAMEADRLQGRAAGEFAPEVHPHDWSELDGIPSGFADGVDDDTDTLADLSPSPGQTIRWNGSSWEPVSLPATDQFPVAVLQADPAVLWPGETTTTLSLALSYDPEGGSLTYAFDPLGRTVGEPGSYGGSPTMIASYTGAGDFLAAGWVKDPNGAYSRAQVQISVFSFRTSTVDSEGDVGREVSLAEIDGHPAMAYYDGTNAELKYARATEATGGAWARPVNPDISAGVGRHPSLANVNGRPAIAYRDVFSGDVKYIRAEDATGAQWGSPAVPDDSGNVHSYHSLAVVDGHPAIAYFDQTDLDLMYVRADDPAGGTWGTPVPVDTVDDVGAFASLAVVDGRPAVAYYDSTNEDLKYVRANDATGATWGSFTTPDSAGNVGSYTSLAVVDGRPAIAYYDQTNIDLKYVRANDVTGSSWGTPLAPESAGVVGLYASLAVVDGRPAIAHYDSGNEKLKFIRANDAAGATWSNPVSVENSGRVGAHASMAIIAGRPAIAHNDQNNLAALFTIARRD